MMPEQCEQINKNLCWNAIYGNFNKRDIEVFNVFDHGGFYEDCQKAAKKFGDNRAEFDKAVRTSLMYYFWSKCEWEVVVSHWPPSERMQDAKVDVYDQVMMNWLVFSDYVWENRALLKKPRKSK